MPNKNRVSIGKGKPWGDMEFMQSFSEPPKQFVALSRQFFDQLVTAMTGSKDALRSYQYGNSATDLAKDHADNLDLLLFKIRDHEQKVSERSEVANAG